MLLSKKLVSFSFFIASTILGLSLFGFSEAKPIVSSTLTKSPAAQATNARFKVGVSIPAADHGWTAGVVWWAKECSKLHPEIDWMIATAETPEKQIADIFNDFFISKIEKLKEGIDKDYVKDPLEKLKKKMESKKLKFSLKQVTVKQWKKL